MRGDTKSKHCHFIIYLFFLFSFTSALWFDNMLCCCFCCFPQQSLGDVIIQIFLPSFCLSSFVEDCWGSNNSHYFSWRKWWRGYASKSIHSRFKGGFNLLSLSSLVTQNIIILVVPFKTLIPLAHRHTFLLLRLTTQNPIPGPFQLSNRPVMKQPLVCSNIMTWWTNSIFTVIWK